MITLEILAAYLPYGLQMQNTKSGRIIDVRGFREGVSTIHVLATIKDGIQFKDVEYQLDLWPLLPILRPLSEFKEQYARSLGYGSVLQLRVAIINKSVIWSALNQLLADHYNVFNLKENEYIRKG